MDKIEETPPVAPKQFLMVVDEVSMALLGRMVPGIKFLAVEGMDIPGNTNHRILVTPIKAVVAETQPVESTELVAE